MIWLGERNMEVLFLDAPFSGTVELSKDTLAYLKKKKHKIVALYASVQFVNNLDLVRKQLADNDIMPVTSHADRTQVKGQLLGCDNYHNSLNMPRENMKEIDCYLYVGDGKFHPLALVYAQKDLHEMKEIVCNDPLIKKMSLMGVNDIKKILLRYRASLMKFLAAKNIGVIVTVKPGQEQFRPSLALEKRYADKKFYYFIDDVVSFDQLENFNFIEVWINTTCPRVGFDDQEKFAKGVINLNDALMVEDILGRESVLTRL